MKGISISNDRNLEYYHALCTLYLADLMLTMSNTQKSRQLINQVSQFIQQNGYPSDRGYMHLINAKASINDGEGDIVAELKQTIAEYSVVQDLERVEESLLLQAKAFNDVGTQHDRDNASDACLKVRSLREKRSKQQYTGEVLSDVLDNMGWLQGQINYIMKLI
jgi:hypothetical protein